MQMWTIIGQNEKRLAQIVLILTVLALAAAIGIGALVFQNQRLHDQVEMLEGKRIMIGLPNEEGYFVSTDKIPRREVLDYAHGFVVNCYNWNRASVDVNMQECRDRMDESLALQRENWFDSRSRQAESQRVTSTYIPDRRKLERTSNGYRYIVEGPQQRLQGRTIYYSQRHRITVNMRQGQPTAFRPLGLTVENWSDKCVDCD